MVICVQSLSGTYTLHAQPIQDRYTVPILLDRDPLHVDPGRRRALVRLDDAPCGLAHPAGPPGGRVTRLV